MPVASLAADAATRSSMRRCASEWAVGIAATKRRSFWVPRASCSLKATAVTALWASSDFAPSGVYDYGTLEEDGPETWEALTSPCETTGLSGEPVTSLRRAVCLRDAHAAGRRAAQNKHPPQGRPKAREDRSRGRRESGSRRAAYELRRQGTGRHPDPAEQRRPVLM